MQTWLNGIRDSCSWHAALTVDGKFGANAEKAVREFQLRYGLKEDGKVGANTWNVLYARYTAKHGLIVPYPGIVLRSGSVGGCVRLVQQKLNADGERLTTDGKFGASTVAAVKRYQTRHSLTSDGSVARVAAPSVCFGPWCGPRILLAAAPTAPPCFRRWRRSSPLPPRQTPPTLL